MESVWMDFVMTLSCEPLGFVTGGVWTGNFVLTVSS